MWKRWLSAAAVFVAVFMGIKEASAQNNILQDSSNHQKSKFSNSLGGEIVLVSNHIPSASVLLQKIYAFNEVDTWPSFPGGTKAFFNYLRKNFSSAANLNETVAASFVIRKDGSITNVIILDSINSLIADEAIKALEKSPKWISGRKDGKAVDVIDKVF